ncbi:MAG: serine hydrolase [Saprospiraceae bacterium]
MKKVPVIPFLLSLTPVLITFFFSLTSWVSPVTPTIEENKIIAAAPILASDHITAPLPTLSIKTLPMDVPADAVTPLEELHSQVLQDKLDEIVRSNSHWASLAKNKTLNIGIVDMSDPLNARYAAINSNNMVYAASLPKIAVLLASQESIEQGKITETAEVKADMRMMIAKSSNSAATRMINRCGLKEIGQIMQDPRYNLYDPANGGGLWVGKAYGGSSGRIGDPIKNLSHAASVMQVCKYYYKLAFGQLVSPEGSKAMLDVLVDPELHHKFVSVLDRVAPNAKVYRKSGTWENWHTDSAMVWDEDRKYIVVALAEDAGGETMLRELMLKIDTALVAKG